MVSVASIIFLIISYGFSRKIDFLRRKIFHSSEFKSDPDFFVAFFRPRYRAKIQCIMTGIR